ncbi:MAG TPA: class I adenylate-forming enzyme family protein [Mycobacteriales bacterium]|nr:class I adenylate-forming enzyme family protein [Mycobacteriales bacterium]
MLGSVAREAARRFGDRPAFVAGEQTVSFQDLDARADRVAAGLMARGVGEGDVVALALGTVPDYPVAYLAAARLGAITAGLNTRLVPAQQARLLEVARPKLLIGESRFSADLATKTTTVAELEAAGDGAAAPPQLPPDPARPVAIVFTSGTTGVPKGAVFGERQLDAIRAIDVGPNWGAGGATLIGTSLSHLGFMTKFPGALQAGRTTHLLARWNAGDALTLTSVLGLTSLSGVPTQLALMLAHPSFDALDLSALRMVLIGGGPASPALVREARERLGVPVCTRYSCTEAGIGCGTAATDPDEDAETTVGRPQPGVELRIRDAAGADCPTGAVGEVVLRSAAVMSGYWDNPEASAAAFTPDGFARTGDLGWVDDRGRLHLAGRSTEVYVRGGYNVHPVAVEAVLSNHPNVRDLAIVPAPSDVMGQIGVAVVVPDGDPPTLDDLRRYGGDQLARHELPERLVVVDELPLTPGDKVDRAALQAVVRADP